MESDVNGRNFLGTVIPSSKQRKCRLAIGEIQRKHEYWKPTTSSGKKTKGEPAFTGSLYFRNPALSHGRIKCLKYLLCHSFTGFY